MYAVELKNDNFNFRRKTRMKITLDLETKEIIVPKNFFTVIQKQNELISENGGKPVKPMDVIRKAFNAALDNSDKYVHVKQVRAKSTKEKEKEKEKE